jgi:endogenous inhibitor of DNA gyrase (YacG/DUF329 family)
MTPKPRTCPVCGKPSDPRYRPACSRHCSYVDLGRWLNGSYVVPGETPLAAAGSGLGAEDED